MAQRGLFSKLLGVGLDLLAQSGKKKRTPGRRKQRHVAPQQTAAAGQTGRTATIEVDPHRLGKVKLSYAPERDGDPDAGEIVWTWVPYEERDGRGKDRPVLVVARQDAERVYAVKLTSKDHDGSREYVSIGSGAWDSRGRESWVDLDQVYSVHNDGLRREAAALDLDRYTRVALELQKRFGWDA